MIKMQAPATTWLFSILLVVLLGSSMSMRAASDAEAAEITQEYDRLQSLWLSQMKLATDARSRSIIAKKQPDPAEFAAKLKKLLRNDLAHDWTLKYAAWLLNNDPAITAQSQRTLLDAVQNHHLSSSKLGPFCVAMVQLNDRGVLPPAGKLPIRSRGMKLLKEIKTVNPSPEVQGQAALALSIMLASLGDDPRIMAQRIQNLREAIIKSADISLGSVTVADVARDELFKINYLSRGKEAPEIVGSDSAGRPLRLSNFRGKVVMLVFWSSEDPQVAKALELLRESAASKINKPFVMLGVNKDALANLRTLEAERIVTWRNFSDPSQKIAQLYHVSSWPYCMVLDQKGRIQHKGSVGSFADAVVNDLLVTKP